MTLPALRIERSDASHARVTGRLGFIEAPAAFARSEELLNGAASEMSVDVAGVEAVDSATLAVLLAWAARAQTDGKRIRYTGVPVGLRALAHLCDAEPMLGIA
ncbi:MAG: STAS domain-containing protein [Dokdonella sp.]|uniref:STAS domain-containing protein n=1 Tax=Dokdonella sp. TaxID=2291710 RepID=UPI0032675F4E